MLGRSVTTRREQRLADLYGQYARDAVRVAFLLTGDQHTAEDIVQDAFVRLFSRFQELRSPDAFETYLRRTVVNLCRDRFRRLKLERDYAARRATSVSSGIGVSSQIETRALIRDALQKLPHRQRAVLVLRFYTDLSEQQTAEVMQCSVAAVKSLATRATATLRKDIGEEAL